MLIDRNQSRAEKNENAKIENSENSIKNEKKPFNHFAFFSNLVLMLLISITICIQVKIWNNFYAQFY